MTESERRHFEEVQAIGYRPLMRGALWCTGGVILVAVGLYSAFWLPYRDPASEVPHPIPILPLPPPHSSTVDPPSREYEWVDREAGIVRLPIEDAMQIIPGRLPVREDAKHTPHSATDAGSGRTPQRAGE